jgi:hypothetical protein
MAKPITFTLTLTQAQYNAAAAQLQKMGMKPDQGSLPETSGVQLDYVSARLGLGATVVFTVNRKPRLMPVGFIEGHVKKLLGIG